MSKTYDIIILGAGPAGLAAGLYGGRARLSTLIIEKGQDGGQIATTSEIENYPGGVDHESGKSLIDRMAKQVVQFGAERVSDTVLEVKLDGKIKEVKCVKATYQAKAVIIATGAHPRPIGCEGESDFVGKGVSYCATCDAAFFEELPVYVVGGGDSALEEAMFCANFAREVTIVHRRDEFTAAKSIQEKVKKHPKVKLMLSHQIVKLEGDGILTSMIVKDLKTGKEKRIEASEDDGTFGVFGFVGFVPHTELFVDKIALENGYVKTCENMKTNVDGVFAAGDVRAKSLRQVITAAADGAIAAVQAEHYINK
ncbi:MAG: thioredoxin-disulfide reductase [Firmicutes bacterium]|nr:thioredoxin-disulfide reductase [Bacillota bacterium]